jgi:hypothetical protein
MLHKAEAPCWSLSIRMIRQHAYRMITNASRACQAIEELWRFRRDRIRELHDPKARASIFGRVDQEALVLT